MRLDGVVFDGRDEAREVLTSGGAFDAYADQVLVFGTRFAKEGDGTESLGVDSGDQIGVPGTVFLPKLANLDSSRAHGLYLTVDSPRGSVNTWCRAT